MILIIIICDILWLMRLNSEQLLSFVALAQTGSVSQAAVKRCVTQPAISNQLKRLQDSIGLALYQKHGRGIKLTATGEAFYQYAKHVQKSIHQAETFVEGLQEHTAGRVYIAASQTIAVSLLPAALMLFRRLHPNVEIFVDSGNSSQVFQHMETHDIGFIESFPPKNYPDSYQVRCLGHDKITAVMRHDHVLANQQSITLSDLFQHDMIWREEGSGTRDILTQAWQTQTGEHPKVQQCLGGISATLEATRQGLGVCAASQHCLPSGESILTTRPIDPLLTRPISMVLPQNRPLLTMQVSSFMQNHLKETLA